MRRKFILLIILIIFLVFASIKISVHANVVTPAEINNNSFYYIRNKVTGLYLQDDSNNNLVNDANVIQSNYCDGDKQLFRFMRLNTTVFEIYSELNSQKCFCVQNSQSFNNIKIGLEDVGTTHPLNHRFKFVDTGDGDNSYYILTATSKYKKYVSVISNSIGAYVLQRSYSASDYNKWYLEGINLNDIMTVQLNVGEERTFKYFVPDNLLYAAETSKFSGYNVDTALSIYNLQETVFTDDDSGEGYYSYIGFRNQANKVIKIKLHLYGSSSGYFYFQLRKQQAVLYGFKYDDINTISDLNAPYNELSSFYQTYKFENKNRSHFLSEDDRYCKRCNSEIVFFSGHGSVGSASFLLNAVYDSTLDTLYYDEIPKMNNTKIAVWSSCKSASEIDGTSMISKSVEQGAKSSIGFPDSVSATSAKKFTDKLFEYLCAGETIGQAASHAASHIIWPFDKVKNYQIAGSLNTQIISSNAIDNLSCSSASLNMYEEILRNNEFVAFQNSDGSIRYYFAIDGIITNYFVDIRREEKTEYRGNLKNIEKNNLTILPIYEKYLKDDSNIVYYISNNIAVPVLCEEMYEKGKYEIKCTNLYDGSKIKYENIGYWEE